MLDNSCSIALFLLIVFRIRTGSLLLFSNCFNHIFFSKFSLPFEEYVLFFIFILIFIFTLWYSYKNLHEARLRKSSFNFVHHTGWYNDNKTNIKTCTSEKNNALKTFAGLQLWIIKSLQVFCSNSIQLSTYRDVVLANNYLIFGPPWEVSVHAWIHECVIQLKPVLLRICLLKLLII